MKIKFCVITIMIIFLLGCFVLISSCGPMRYTNKEPAFSFNLIPGYTREKLDNEFEVVRYAAPSNRRIPKYAAAVVPKPADLELSDTAQFIIDILQTSYPDASRFTLLKDYGVTLTDGTSAQAIHIKWKWIDGLNMIKSAIVVAFSGDKLVYYSGTDLISGSSMDELMAQCMTLTLQGGKMKSPEPKEKAIKTPDPKDKKIKSPKSKVKTIKTPVPKDEKIKSSKSKVKTIKTPVPKDEKIKSSKSKVKTIKTPVPKDEIMKSPDPKEKVIKTPVPKDTAQKKKNDKKPVKKIQPIQKEQTNKEIIYFSNKTHRLNKNAIQTLNTTVLGLFENPKTTLVIEGHANDYKNSERNLMLGELRAGSVKSYLIQQGINEKRLRVISFGAERSYRGAKKYRIKNWRVCFLITHLEKKKH